jgi:hypothetical protein
LRAVYSRENHGDSSRRASPTGEFEIHNNFQTAFFFFVTTTRGARCRGSDQSMRSDKRGRRKILFVVVAFSSLVLFTLVSHARPFVEVVSSSSSTERDSSPSASSPSFKRVSVVTYTDRATDGLCLSALTAALQGIELVIVGVAGDEDHELDFSNVTNAKTRKLHAFVALLTNDDLWSKYVVSPLDTEEKHLVVFVDASDVLYLKPSEYIASAYEKTIAEHPGHPHRETDVVLLAAERNCWPHMDGPRERIPGGRDFCANFDTLVAEASSFKYPNSGGFMGPRKALAKAIDDIRSEMRTAEDDDQLCVQKAMIRRQDATYDFRLDYKSRVFQTGWGTNLETKDFGVQSVGAYFDANRSVILNTEHGTEPAIVHFNGGKVALTPVGEALLKRRASVSFVDEKRERRRFFEIDSRYRQRHTSWYDLTCGKYLDMVKGSPLTLEARAD